MFKIGIITPFSNEFPFMARDFAKGLKLIFSGNENVDFVHAETERGVPNEVLPLFRRLITKDEVNLIVCFLEISSISVITELINQTKTPVIFAGMGARLPMAVSQSSPWIFYNTYRMWESCWMAGNEAVNEKGKEVGVISSFFDSGYPLVYAHVKGAEKAGGNAVFFNITHKETLDDELRGAKQNIEQIPADYYFASYYGKERAFILNWLQHEAGIDKNRIVASPGIKPNGEHVAMVSSWHKDLDLQPNKEFLENFESATRQEASEFAMLGYETGSLIREVLGASPDDFDPVLFSANLRKVQLESPRGLVKMNDKTQATYSDHFAITANNPVDGKQFRVISYPKDEVEQEIESNAITNSIGWQNTYLCK